MLLLQVLLLQVLLLRHVDLMLTLDAAWCRTEMRRQRKKSGVLSHRQHRNIVRALRYTKAERHDEAPP